MTQANVLPSDREAAADLLDEISSLLDHNGIGQVADLIRDGEYDEHEATIAFARHRDASVRELVPNTLLDELKAVKRAMEIVEFRAREPDLDLDQSRCRAILKDVLAALASAGAQP